MRRPLVLILLAALLAPALAQDQSNISLKPTPPPISCLNFFKGVRQLTVTYLYMKMGEAEDSGMEEAPTAWGFQGEMAEGAREGVGAMVNAMFMKINVPMDNENYPAFMIGTNALLVKDLIQGEKKDIAGEITELKNTVAVFGGLGFTYTNFTMEDFMNSGLDMSMNTSEFSFPLGVAAELPLNPMISLVPFGRFAISKTSMSMTVPYPMMVIDSYVPFTYHYVWNLDYVDSSYTSTRLDFGSDVNIRPFRNSPEWKISVGTVLSQISGMSKGNLLFIVSVKREWGKYYSSTMFGPKLY